MLRAALAVRINDGQTDRHVTGHVSGLRFKKTAPGGYHSASFTIAIDPGEFTDLSAADRVWVYGPTGETIWEGYLDNPAAVDGASGRSLEISAMGTMILASDQRVQLIYADRDLGMWDQWLGGNAAASASATTAGDPTTPDSETQGLLTQFNPGQPIGPGSLAQIGYVGFQRAPGWQFGAISVRLKSGKAAPPAAPDTSYQTDLAYSVAGGGSGFLAIGGAGIRTTPGVVQRWVGEAGNPPALTTGLALRLRRVGAATNVVDDKTWSFFDDVIVTGRRMLRDGSLVLGVAGMVTTDYVRADWVVEDLVGRVLRPVLDQHSVEIEAGTWPIDQLTYHAGATPAEVFDDLALWEPNHYWGFGASTARGVRFYYRKWPTVPRYEISTRDGYDAPGSDLDLCNRVAVTWTDPAGKERTTAVWAASGPGVIPPGAPAGTVPAVFGSALAALESVGRVRDAEPVTLPEGQGSAANAQRIGTMVLEDRVNPPKAATATVSREIFDKSAGRWVAPYEIQPGCLVAVRETGDVLRLTEVDYDDEQGAATLTLGTPVLSIEQRVARLARTRR